jgi:Ca2+-binding RTX toxin-like protein
LVLNSEFTQNHGNAFGGAVAVMEGPAYFINSTFAGNSLNLLNESGGGAIAAFGAPVGVLNSTFYGNSAHYGGALAGNASHFYLAHSTFTGNEGVFGGAIYGSGAAYVDAQNTIIAGNPSIEGGALDVFGITEFNSDGGNVFSQAGLAGEGDAVNADLSAIFKDVVTNPYTGQTSGRLAQNGGPVSTVKLRHDGPALNHVQSPFADIFDLDDDGDFLENLPIDARGFVRPSGSLPDSGALELVLLEGTGGGDTLSVGANFYEAVLGQEGNDTITGGASADILDGGLQHDVIDGGDGSDEIYGKQGDDRLDGGDGYDLTSAQKSILRLYEATLDRPPDVPGLAGWVAALNGGQSLVSIAAGFVASVEFQNVYGMLDNEQFVTLLYNNVLDRAPDQAGLDGWVDQIEAGASRASVVVGFSESPEFRGNTAFDTKAFATNVLFGEAPGKVFRLYQATLDRAPDQLGFVGWVDALAAGNTLLSITTGFINSPEFQSVYGSLDNEAFVTLLYNNVLDRAPDQAGLDAWVAQLEGGASRESVVNGFSESFEFRNNTKVALRDFMQDSLGGFNDLLVGAQEHDLLFGGFGADQFEFNASEDGLDEIFGFDAFDTLSFVNFGYADAAEALTHFAQDGADVLFSDQGVDVLFHNTTLATLQDADFLFG